MTTATQFLNMARSQVGFREGADNANKYGLWYGMDHQPYCAIGLTWTAFQVGGLDAIGGRWYRVIPFAQWFRDRHRFFGSGQRGDIVFFDWTGRQRAGSEQHVGIVESVSGSYVQTIEFNTTSGVAGSQSDGGGVYKRTRHISMIVGFGRPLYTPETDVAPLVTSVGYRSTDPVPLVIDGAWGPATTRRLQALLKIRKTGVMDGATFSAMSVWLGQTKSAKWTPEMRTALQHRVGAVADGVIGPKTVRAFQRFLNRN